MIGLWAGAHGDGLHALRVGSQRRDLRSAVGGVAGLAQLIGDEALVELLSGADLARGGKDFGGVGKDGLLEPLVHNVLIFDVEIAEDGEADEHDGRDRDQRNTQ